LYREGGCEIKCMSSSGMLKGVTEEDRPSKVRKTPSTPAGTTFSGGEQLMEKTIGKGPSKQAGRGNVGKGSPEVYSGNAIVPEKKGAS